MDLLAETVETRRSRGQEQALAIVASDSGPKSLQQIRSAVANMNAIERELLGERGVRFNQVAGHSKVAISIWTTAAFGFLALAVVFTFHVLGGFREATAVAAREAAPASEQRRQVQRQNEALARSEVRFRKLLEFAPDAMVVINPRGEIVFLNPLAETDVR